MCAYIGFDPALAAAYNPAAQDNDYPQDLQDAEKI
jgi:hypothetical protein